MTDSYTKVYCIIGNPVRHSMSPQVHNAAFAKRGVNAVYVAFEVSDVQNAVRGMRALGIGGASVTIPHKLAVIPFLDEIEEPAKMIGAVNTIVNEKGRLIGFNTDGPGAVKSLKDAGVKIKGRKVAMIGSGGAARAVSFTLAFREKISEIAILGIVPSEISNLVADLSKKTGVSSRGITLDKKKEAAMKTVEAADIIINASPIGMHPKQDHAPIPSEWIRPDAAVFDVVYNPLETRFIREATLRGCKTVLGVEMFLNQAVLQFERWTGKSAPIKTMRRIVLKNLKAK